MKRLTLDQLSDGERHEVFDAFGPDPDMQLYGRGLEGRMSVRTPMQWTAEPTASSSQARSSKLRRPLPEGRYGPLAVNVTQQRRDTDSLMSWMERSSAGGGRRPSSAGASRPCPPAADRLELQELERYGYRWFRVQQPGGRSAP